MVCARDLRLPKAVRAHSRSGASGGCGGTVGNDRRFIVDAGRFPWLDFRGIGGREGVDLVQRGGDPEGAPGHHGRIGAGDRLRRGVDRRIRGRGGADCPSIGLSPHRDATFGRKRMEPRRGAEDGRTVRGRSCFRGGLFSAGHATEGAAFCGCVPDEVRRRSGDRNRLGVRRVDACGSDVSDRSGRSKKHARRTGAYRGIRGRRGEDLVFGGRPGQ